MMAAYYLTLMALVSDFTLNAFELRDITNQFFQGSVAQKPQAERLLAERENIKVYQQATPEELPFEEPSETISVSLNNKPVATIKFGRQEVNDTQHRQIIDKVQVFDTQHQGLGLGSALMRHVLSQCKTPECIGTVLTASPLNENERTTEYRKRLEIFYKGLGGEVTTQTPTGTNFTFKPIR